MDKVWQVRQGYIVLDRMEMLKKWRIVLKYECLRKYIRKTKLTLVLNT